LNDPRISLCRARRDVSAGRRGREGQVQVFLLGANSLVQWFWLFCSFATFRHG